MGKTVSVRDRIVELIRVPANKLVRNEKNWRTHSESQKKALRGALEQVGFAGAELCRRLPDGGLMLIDGHMRADVMGKSLVPVLVLDVDEREADLLLSTFDPIGAMAGRDDGKLESLLESLRVSESVSDFVRESAEVEIVGGDESDADEQSGASSEPKSDKAAYPLSVLLTRDELRTWAALKKELDVKSDKECLLGLIHEHG